MDKRKEMNFNPEKINFVAVIDSINWCREVTPVDLVKAVNNVEGLRGRKRYETNEKSFGLLIKCFEKIVGDFVTTRINGKDRFYMLKPEYKPEQLVGYARTGKIPEIKEELKKKDSKFYIPEVPESMMGAEGEVKAKRSTKKRIFPDCEAMAKSAILLSLLKNGEGKVEARIFNEIRDKFGWKYQRSIDSTPYTAYLEVNRFCADYLDLGKDLIKLDKKDNHYKYTGDITILEDKIKDTLTLMEDEDLKKKVQEFIKEEKVEEKVEPKIEEVVKEKPKSKEKIDEEKPKPEIRSIEQPFKEPNKTLERPRVIKASPVIGKSEFRETGSAPIVYESSRVKWNKSLVAMTLNGARRGTWITFEDMSKIIKRMRYVDISPKELKEICNDVLRRFRGLFREIVDGGITIGNEDLIEDFINAYPQDKITETIFIRLHMSIDELTETYPELKIKVASEIGENDNIVEIEMNRAEKTEKAFAKLVFRMRQGEIILESPSNWTIKRSKILIDKLFGGM